LNLFGAGKKDARVSVLDTTKLGADNLVLYVPELAHLFPAQTNIDHYVVEYLVYGTVASDCFKTTSFEDFERFVDLKYFEDQPQDMFVLPQGGPQPFTRAEVDAAQTLGMLYGEPYTIPIAAAVPCLKRCDLAGWISLQREPHTNVSMFREALREHDFPKCLQRNEWDTLLDFLSEDLRQMNMLLFRASQLQVLKRLFG
jgi:hypothetical protein